MSELFETAKKITNDYARELIRQKRYDELEIMFEHAHKQFEIMHRMAQDAAAIATKALNDRDMWKLRYEELKNK